MILIEDCLYESYSIQISLVLYSVSVVYSVGKTRHYNETYYVVPNAEHDIIMLGRAAHDQRQDCNKHWQR